MEIYRFCFVLLCVRGQFPSNKRGWAYIWRGDLTKGVLRYEFGGLIFGGAHFRNFTVYFCNVSPKSYNLAFLCSLSENIKMNLCCWFSPLLREVFLREHRFSHLKNQHLQISIRSGTQGQISTSS